MPADLVRRRPDVRRAERQVAAQSARIGVAVSDLYPHFSVLGTIGVEAEQFGDLFKSGSMIGEISPGFRWDILNYGRLVNNVRVQDARFQELAYAYQDQVLIAGQEAEDAIVSFLKSQEQAQHLGASVTAASRTVEITNEQYNQGAIDFTAVFVFQENLTEQQDELAVSQGNIALSLIDIYRALGGGWQIRLGAGNLSESEVLERPLLEEIPPPGADNDIQFPSIVSQPTFMRLPSTESATEPTPPSDMPVADKSSRFAGAKAVMTLKRTMLLTVCVGIALGRLAMAQEPAAPRQSLYPFHTLVCPNDLLRACCNTYCKKPQPCIGCFCSGCGDCYCPKPLPCIPCFDVGRTSNCYCQKPCPDFCRPIAADYYRCVPGCAGCTESGAYGSAGVFPGTQSQAEYSDGSEMEHSSTPTPPQPN